jgi:rhamnose transport system substrate-binding protein
MASTPRLASPRAAGIGIGALAFVVLAGPIGAQAQSPAGSTAPGGSAVADCGGGHRIFHTGKWTGFPYFELAQLGIVDAATELGDTVTYGGADKPDTQLQVQTLQNFVAQKPDAIILAAIDLNAVAPVLEQARADGVKVVTYDADAAIPARDAFANQLSYRQAAQVMLDAALIDAPEGGEIAYVAASPTSPNHTAHIQNMNDLIATDPKYGVFTVVDTQYAEDDDAKSYDVAVNLMQAHPNLKVIISSSAVSAPAAARAIQATGKSGQVFATGFALPNSIKSYIEDGSEKAFALWDPKELGYVSAFMAHQLICGTLDTSEGATFTAGKAGQFTFGADGEVVYGRPLIFTKDNIADYDF